jgi:hypothetical protein
LCVFKILQRLADFIVIPYHTRIMTCLIHVNAKSIPIYNFFRGGKRIVKRMLQAAVMLKCQTLL